MRESDREREAEKNERATLTPHPPLQGIRSRDREMGHIASHLGQKRETLQLQYLVGSQAHQEFRVGGRVVAGPAGARAGPLGWRVALGNGRVAVGAAREVGETELDRQRGYREVKVLSVVDAVEDDLGERGRGRGREREDGRGELCGIVHIRVRVGENFTVEFCANSTIFFHSVTASQWVGQMSGQRGGGQSGVGHPVPTEHCYCETLVWTHQ